MRRSDGGLGRSWVGLGWQSVLAWASSPPVTLSASLVRYEYDSGKKRFQEQLQTNFSKQELQKVYYCIFFGQTSENKLELELNFKKDKLL